MVVEMKYEIEFWAMLVISHIYFANSNFFSNNLNLFNCIVGIVWFIMAIIATFGGD